MSVIAIVGAGPGLGAEIARAFGRRGFAIALVARNAQKLHTLVAELTTEGFEAAGFVGDILKPDTIIDAFAQVKERFGTIDVLEFSPLDTRLGAVDVLDVNVGNLQPQIDFYVNGAIHVVQQVVHDMIAANSGTILITTGGGSITPVPFLANINIAAAGLRNWTLNLHNRVKSSNVYVAHIAISASIGGGHPDAEPAVIAETYLRLYDNRSEPEVHYVALHE